MRSSELPTDSARRRSRDKNLASHLAAGTYKPRARQARESNGTTSAPRSMDHRFVEAWEHRLPGDRTIARYVAKTADEGRIEDASLGYGGAAAIGSPFTG